MPRVKLKMTWIARFWTAVDMFTPLLPQAVPLVDADPMSILSGRG